MKTVRGPVAFLLVNCGVSGAACDVHTGSCEGRPFVRFGPVYGVREGVVRTGETPCSLLECAIGGCLRVFTARAVRRRLRVQACPPQLARFRPQDFDRDVARVLNEVLRFFYVCDCHVRYKAFRAKGPIERRCRFARLDR